MTEDPAPQQHPVKETGKYPLGFWWIAIGIVLLLCGIAIVISVLPRLMDGSIIDTSNDRRHAEMFFIGPLLPGIFAIAYGIDLRRKAGLSYIPFFFSGIATDKEKK